MEQKSKDPQDPAVETTIEPGRLEQKSKEPQDLANENIALLLIKNWPDYYLSIKK